MSREFNPHTGKVLRDTAYSSRFILEDDSGNFARKQKSHCATRAPVRFWSSYESAQKALNAMLHKGQK